MIAGGVCAVVERRCVVGDGDEPSCDGAAGHDEEVDVLGGCELRVGDAELQEERGLGSCSGGIDAGKGDFVLVVLRVVRGSASGGGVGCAGDGKLAVAER